MIVFNSAKTKQSILTALGVLVMAFTQTLSAQQPAFPGAEGAGMYTTGGRGTTATPTTVFEVTNLSDDGQPGSLRYALTAAATYRTVVFRVSGTIHLTSKLRINGNTTVAGQTAPGDGICVADYPTVISGDNVIVRYMRFRMGDRYQNKGMVDGAGSDDAFGGLNVSNVIIDHCSVSWSTDEVLTIYRGDNLTIQWCFITEPLNYSYHFEAGDSDFEQHGYGGIWGAKHGSFHHNLFADCRNRNPRFAGISTYSPSTIGVENCDFRNNVIYNWGINTVYGGEGGNYNVVNNYYKYGPNTSNGVRYRIANPSYSSTVTYGKWFVDGNYVDGSPTNTADNWSGVVVQGGSADVPKVKVTTPFDIGYPLSSEPALQAYESVLQKAGCSLPNRDTLDERIVNDVRNRTGRIIDVQGGYPHGTPYDQTVNAWPTLNSTAAPADADHDGMPDSWEAANGLNPNDASDRNGVATNGYTNLENYLNSLAVGEANTSPTIYVGASLAGFAQTVGTPSAVQTYSVSGVNLSEAITIIAPAGFEISKDGVTWSNSLTLTASSGSVSPTIISVRLNAATTGSYTGTIVHTSAGAADMNLDVNGVTSGSYQNVAIGSFPEMDGGFENQLAGNGSTIGSGGTHSSTIAWEASAAFNIDSLNARTGLKSVHWNQSSSSNKYMFTPVLTAHPLEANAPYVVQFWYRVPQELVNNSTTPISLYGWATVDGQTGGSGISLTSQKAELGQSTQTGTWMLFTGTLTSPSSTPTSTYTGIRITNPQSPYFDIDDYVVYAGTAVDNVAPDPVPQASANGNTSENNITVSWSAPPAGVDDGGYMVVRSALATAPVPNEKGVYVTGNHIGNDYTVVYVGTENRFVDTDVSSGTSYHYFIFTIDKAFNYASAVAVDGAVDVSHPVISVTESLNHFSQTVGTPSSSQSFTINGASLTGDVVITAPTGYEVSEDDNTWSHSLSFAPANGSVQATVMIRLNAIAPGAYAGSVTVESKDATTVELAVSGTASNPVVIPPGTKVIVAADGSGDFVSIQAAIDAAPANATAPYKIYIEKGRYVEAVKIPSNKPFLQLVGESLAETIISYDNYSGKPNPAGGTYGTSTCGTLIINAPDVMLMNLSVENSVAYGKDADAIPPAPGDGPQAVAVYTTSDRVVFYNCRFNGGQDTYYGGNVKGTRAYLKNCYIDGNTDFLFGSSTIIFDTCIIYPRTRLDGGSGGYVTAVNTKAESGYGYVFRDCKITLNRGTTYYSLGRPWQNDDVTADNAKSHNKVAFLNTQMGSSILPAGWSVWNSGTNTDYITYAEYNSKNFDGSAVDVSHRVPWSIQLTADEAAKYYNNDTVFVNADTPDMPVWDPYALWPELSHTFSPELAVSNLIARKGNSSSTITWNLSWPLPDVTCDLYRSTDKANFELISSQVCAEDSAGNFSYSEALPAAGQTYYYIVRSSKAGLASTTSDTAMVSSTPVITVTGTPGSFLQGLGTPTAPQNYVVSGENILDNITVTPPTGYEVSADGGTTWFNHNAPLVLAANNGKVGNTTIAVRLNATAAGDYTGDIVHTSSGAATVSLSLSGTVQTEPLPVSEVLQYWPMAQDNKDSAVVRSAGATASVPRFSNFTVSDGITVPSVPAYSATRGQAFAATADGLWTTASGGPGGNLSRVHYEEFTVTAAAGYSLRVDSLLLKAAFYNSSSHTSLAVVYSLDEFATDSTELSNASFANPAVLLNQTSGPDQMISLALNGAEGLTIDEGKTVTLRLYFSCGSTSPGRYAQLKDVIVKGSAESKIVPASLSVDANLDAFEQTVGALSVVQTYTITGSDLTSDVTVTPPVAYEVSADNGATWFNASSPLVLTPNNGALNKTITVRLNASAAGSYNGDVEHATDGVETVRVAVNGSAVAPPALTVTQALTPFIQQRGTPSDAQTFTVKGSGLKGNVTITPPAHFELSLNGSAWVAGPVTLAPEFGTLNSTTVSVRLNGSIPGPYMGNLVHTSNGLEAVNVPVAGVVTIKDRFGIYPVPASRMVFLAHPQNTGKLVINIYSVSGERLTVLHPATGSVETPLDISNMRQGVFIVEFSDGTEKTVLRFVKQ